MARPLIEGMDYRLNASWPPGMAPSYSAQGAGGTFERSVDATGRNRLSFRADRVGRNGVIRFSTYASWLAFGRHYVSGVDAALESDGILLEQAFRAALSSRLPDDSDLDAIRRWIARNIRYNIARGDIRLMFNPRPLDEVLSSRQGDCKDLAMLLQAMLARIHLDAYPVLTTFTASNRLLLDERVPTSMPFDHVIVYVPSLNRYYDATLEESQMSEDITQYVPFGLDTRKGTLVSFPGRWVRR